MALTPHASMPAVSYRRPTLALSLVAEGAERPRTPVIGHVVPAAALDALLDALRTERRLLDDLAATMRRQRAAVGSDDLQSVDDSVFATHRILATLGQARVRRRQINRMIAGVEELPARELDTALGPQMTEALRSARDELQQSAGALSREVEVNRRVLRDAIASGDAHARVLVGAATGEPTSVPNGYAASPTPAPMPGGGTLINRTA